MQRIPADMEVDGEMIIPETDQLVKSIPRKTRRPLTVEVYILFFDGDMVVSHDSAYFIDDDSVLKPGECIEMDCYEDYDSFMVILTGRSK